MRGVPKDIDAVDLLYAIDSLTSRKPLREMGLNRRGLKGATTAQRWFWNEMCKAIEARVRRYNNKKGRK